MNRGFTALSGIAMLLIVVNHTIHMGTNVPVEFGYPPVTGIAQSILIFLQALGAFAVPTFLFISGSFVAYAARSQKKVLSVRFIWASVRHILWPYLIWSVIFFVAAYLNRGWTYSLTGYLKNLVVGFPFHFIPLLMFYYIISPVLVILGRRLSWLLIGGIALYQLLLIWLQNPAVFPAAPAQLQLLVPPVIGSTMADWAIYFPMGLVYNLQAANTLPWLKRYRWVLILLTVLTFTAGLLDGLGVLTVPIARFITPFFLILALPTVQRSEIPLVKFFENIGKRSYGLYLTHLIVLDTTLLVIRSIFPGFIQLYVLLLPILFVVALGVPLWVMRKFAANPRTRNAYRFVFG